MVQVRLEDDGGTVALKRRLHHYNAHTQRLSSASSRVILPRRAPTGPFGGPDMTQRAIEQLADQPDATHSRRHDN
ncbi:unnamed protein product [Nippostrongylus brasiliensis]|uniref:DUF1534 domain-containing protein n=1 Tax=Nippostrongylus brasiliensis TaxID=27835 RepID=A0A0N4Y743_NIPBR|nr:hypothetical protein Q1695_008146 [Nippostrongylus brasiliensis]VDL75541.1 unnamed protein product [Nippostrongylus brasiliensis]